LRANDNPQNHGVGVRDSSASVSVYRPPDENLVISQVNQQRLPLDNPFQMKEDNPMDTIQPLFTAIATAPGGRNGPHATRGNVNVELEVSGA
jgi:hypothetical protein